MSTDAKFLFALAWIFSLLGAALYFHDFGMVEGARLERQKHKQEIEEGNRKIQRCLAVIRGNK